jgi:carbohydrate diacid regulator
LVDAYREANLAVDFGERLWGMNKSYYFGDLGILSILGEGNREKEIQFAEQLLSKLTNEDLLQTLECFFDQNLNLTETAQHMGIHRNTVIYRLNQISTILGVDPRVFEQAMTIQIALLIKRLFG